MFLKRVQSPVTEHFFHVEINEKRRETCTCFLFAYSFITLDCSPAYLICTASKSTCQKRNSSFPLRSNKKKWLQLTLKRSSIQRNLVDDLGAHTDSETDTASEAE